MDSHSVVRKEFVVYMALDNTWKDSAKNTTLSVHSVEACAFALVKQLGLRRTLTRALDNWQVVKVTGKLSNHSESWKIALVLQNSCQVGGLMILTFDT